LAELVEAAAVAEEFTFQWRRDTGGGVQVGDARFAVSHGFLRDVGEVVERVLNESGTGVDDVAALCLGTPDARAAQQLAGAVGLDAKRQIAPSFLESIG